MDRLLKSHTVLLTLVLAAAALYLGSRFDRGWIPHDAGLLAQTAERVLEGEWPHRDFDDAYTGGQAFLHALAFRLLGVHLLAPRLVLFAFSLLFLAAFYRLAMRFMGPLGAAGLTLAALIWSVPNYFAGMPSWYNLFFTTFGTLAVCRFVESGRGAWLFAAGLVAGLSCLVKITGLYFIAAILLFLIYHEQHERSEPATGDRSWRRLLFVVGGLFFYMALVVVVFTGRGLMVDLFHFVVPGLVPAAFLAWREIGSRGAGDLARLLRAGTIFAAGAAVPVVLFALPYLLSGSLGALWAGLFQAPQKRIVFNSIPPPGLPVSWAVVPLVALVFIAVWQRRWEKWVAFVFFGAGLALVAFGAEPQIYRGIWGTIRAIGPLAPILGCFALARGADLDARQRQFLFLFLAVAATATLVQFPNGPGIYFCYTAPSLLLALAFLARTAPRSPRFLLATLLAVSCLFAVVWPHRGLIRHLGTLHTEIAYDTDLLIERGGLRVSKLMAIFYHQVITEVIARTEDGDYIYAGPDCPEVYFLTGRKNPTRTIYDFLDADFKSTPPARTERILRQLEDHDVRVVVLNWEPEFSLGVPRDLGEALRRRYPSSIDIYPYTVHWRDRRSDP